MTRPEAKALALGKLRFAHPTYPDPVCYCGMLLSEHGMTDNHGFVEMPSEPSYGQMAWTLLQIYDEMERAKTERVA